MQGERLSNAVGYAFALYFERKKKNKESRLTMNFDLGSSTFTRVGSLRRQSMVESLCDKANVKKNTVTSVSADDTSESLLGTTLININNMNADFEENKGKFVSRLLSNYAKTNQVKYPYIDVFSKISIYDGKSLMIFLK